METAENVPTRVERSEASFPEAEIIRPKAATVWGVLRLMMGFTFLWALLDKLLALGFSTGRNPETGAIDFFGKDAWINGGSPTDGVLQFALHTKGPFVDFYQGLAGSTRVEWAFMLSMAAIGLGLIFGIGTRVAAIGGIIWMAIFYTATALWPQFNPVLDDHVIEAVVLAGIAYVGAGRFLGFGNRWRKLRSSRSTRSSSSRGLDPQGEEAARRPPPWVSIASLPFSGTFPARDDVTFGSKTCDLRP